MNKRNKKRNETASMSGLKLQRSKSEVVRNLGFVHKLDKAAIPKICIAITCFIS
jgi:hypothetical protein